MTASVINDAALSRDIETLRERFTQTQELYREVCALLFFRYGVTPTANKLYQLVRKGRSEEHTSELQSLVRISYAVFCLKKKCKIVIIDIQITLKQMLRTFISIRVNRSTKRRNVHRTNRIHSQ